MAEKKKVEKTAETDAEFLKKSRELDEQMARGYARATTAESKKPKVYEKDEGIIVGQDPDDALGEEGPGTARKKK